MKTSEFLREVKSLDYTAEISHDKIRISWFGKECVCIDLKHQFGIYFYPQNAGNNTHRLYVICMEYARMPIEAREEEEKFYLQKMKSFYDEEYDEEYAYLNVSTAIGYYTLNNSTQNDCYKTQFTQKEIDKIKEEQHTDLSEFKQIPVEED